MAKAKTKREVIRLVSQGVDEVTGKKSTTRYSTTKNRQKDKLCIMKFDKALRKHCEFKEAK